MSYMDASCDPMMSERYSIFSMWAMVLFWALIANFTVFSTSLSAFVLVVAHVMWEIGRFAVALSLLTFAFGCGIGALKHDDENFRSIPSAVLSLYSMVIGIYQPDYGQLLAQDPSLLGAIIVFMAVVAILLLNLLIAQLTQSYTTIFKDMVGYALLNRASLIVRSLDSCPKKKWDDFVESLHFDRKLDFIDGDIGPASGIQVYEPSNQNS